MDPTWIHALKDPGTGYDKLDQSILVAFLIRWLILSVALFVAAKITREQEGFLTAVLCALVASLIFSATLYLLAMAGLTGWVALIIAIIVGSAVVAAFYRARWIKGLILGVLGLLIAAVIEWLLPL